MVLSILVLKVQATLFEQKLKVPTDCCSVLKNIVFRIISFFFSLIDLLFLISNYTVSTEVKDTTDGLLW